MDLNQELQKMTVEGLTELGTWVKGLKDFTVEQAPLFVKEYATWYVYSNAVWALTFAVACGVCVWVGTKYANSIFKKRDKESVYSNERANLTVGGWMIRVFALSTASVFFFVSAHKLEETGKGIFAPRLVIAEGILSLAKTGQAQVHK